MVTTLLLGFVWNIFKPLVLAIPDIVIDGYGIFELIAQIINVAYWFLPSGTVLAIITIQLALWSLRVIVALWHSIIAFLP